MMKNPMNSYGGFSFVLLPGFVGLRKNSKKKKRKQTPNHSKFGPQSSEKNGSTPFFATKPMVATRGPETAQKARFLQNYKNLKNENKFSKNSQTIFRNMKINKAMK